MKRSEPSFSALLEYFPEVPLPVVLTEESARDFSRHNDALPEAVIARWLRPHEANWDELSEIVPCLRIPDTYGFHALVYWRAGLMHYQYRMLTFTKDGDYIDRRTLAGTISDGQTLANSVAVIEEDWEILVLSGHARADSIAAYDASTSVAGQFELLPDGRIIDRRSHDQQPL